MPKRAFSYTTEISGTSSTASVQIFMACRIAQKFANRIPKFDELMTEFGMSRATAHRWIAGMKDARGIARKAP